MRRRVVEQGVAGAVLATLLLGLTGCAGSEEKAAANGAPSGVSSTVASCRAQWGDLEQEIESAGADGNGAAVHDALATRYDALAAAAAYWQANATDQGCGSMLSGQKTALLQLRMFDSRATAFDAVARTQRALAARSRLAVSTLGETPKVAASYATLARLAPALADTLAPGVATLDTFDPAVSAQVEQAVANLALLARSSDAWPGWSTAMSRVTAFQRQQQAKITG